MVVVYLIVGLMAGLGGVVVVLLTGGSLLMALVAYLAAGMLSVFAAAALVAMRASHPHPTARLEGDTHPGAGAVGAHGPRRSPVPVRTEGTRRGHRVDS